MRQPINLIHGLAESMRRHGLSPAELKAGQPAAIWRAMFWRRDHPVLRICDFSQPLRSMLKK